MQLAMNTIAFEPNRWKPDKSLARPLEPILDAVIRAGYSACEIWQYHITNRPTSDVQPLAARAREAGLSIPAIGAYPALHLNGAERQAEMDLFKRVIDACAVLGAKTIKIFCGRIASSEITRDVRAVCLAFLREIVDRAGDRGVTITAETHARTLADSVAACETLLGDIAAAHFRICFQPYDMLDLKRTLADYNELREHISHIHLQARDASGFCLMKESPFDFRAFLRHVRLSGFNELLSVEFVKHCAPAAPADFSDRLVIASAAEDRLFVEDTWRAAAT